jgi:hypothetical protein
MVMFRDALEAIFEKRVTAVGIPTVREGYPSLLAHPAIRNTAARTE